MKNFFSFFVHFRVLILELLIFIFALKFYGPELGIYLSYIQILSIYALYKTFFLIFYSSDPYFDDSYESEKDEK